MVSYDEEESHLTLEQAGAVVVISLFALFILWGRTSSGRQSIERVFGSRRDPNPPVAKSGRAKPSTSGKRSTSSSRKRPSSKRGRAR